jgi:hypothetical protein
MSRKGESRFAPEALEGVKANQEEETVEAIQLNSKERTTAYATGHDFCRIFTEDMKNLYLLGFLLTGDSAKAEQCFVSGLDDCATGNRVFREWARSWARRTVIRNALRVVAPRPSANEVSNPAGSNGSQGAKAQVQPVLSVEVSVLLDLPSFERFAFVMSVLEGYSDQDCALLLGCTRQTLIAARIHALQQVTRSLDHGAKPEEANTKPLHDNRSIVELTFPARMATPA